MADQFDPNRANEIIPPNYVRRRRSERHHGEEPDTAAPMPEEAGVPSGETRTVPAVRPSSRRESAVPDMCTIMIL